MPLKTVAEWRRLPTSLGELCLDTTLRCGQSFRWRKINEEWTCALHGRILSLKQEPHAILYKAAWPECNTRQSHEIASSDVNLSQDDSTAQLLKDYFSLDLNLGSLYEQWSKADTNFRKKAPKFAGVRILSQDAWEALICFICSSNNNIARISQMVHKLCKHYGPLLGYVGDEAIHDFPGPKALAGKDVDAHLRQLGFGYRAKYIAETARIIAEDKPPGWLEGLRNAKGVTSGTVLKREDGRLATYKEAHQELLNLTGVGPKVADCVALMGLGWHEAVPVDTHVWQIAQRDYKMGKTKTKTFNKAMYDAVGDHFRSIWGEYAGWAHSVLFTADLREFADKEVKMVEVSMDSRGKPVDTPQRKRRAPEDTIVASHIKPEPTDDHKSTVTMSEYSKRRRTLRKPS